MTFDFAFDALHRAFALPLGITPRTATVAVDGDRLLARFGLWRLSTTVANVEGTEVTGPYAPFKTVGPAHLSIADRGLTFATNSRRGLCIRFLEPVPGIEPTGRLRHPALTVTVADVDGLAAALAR
ncbi:MAG: hypothetical protein M3326_01675 [Actinomycetota bacterium]|nr:hypothetical protein [Actinomycetota bacterium]